MKSNITLIFALLCISVLAILNLKQIFVKVPLLENRAPTIYSWRKCLETKKCPITCPLNDMDCYRAASYFYRCYDSSEKCLKWENYFQTQNGTAIIDHSFYDCQRGCRPAMNSTYNNIVDCSLTCAEIPSPDGQ